MGAFGHLFSSWGLMLQAPAIIHFIRRRPDTFWIFVTLMGGAIGASFLESRQRAAEAREWAQRILSAKQTLPRHLQRRDRPWYQKAKALLRKLPPGT